MDQKIRIYSLIDIALLLCNINLVGNDRGQMFSTPGLNTVAAILAHSSMQILSRAGMFWLATPPQIKCF